jgi:hypothetical protein
MHCVVCGHLAPPKEPKAAEMGTLMSTSFPFPSPYQPPRLLEALANTHTGKQSRHRRGNIPRLLLYIYVPPRNGPHISVEQGFDQALHRATGQINYNLKHNLSTKIRVIFLCRGSISNKA